MGIMKSQKTFFTTLLIVVFVRASNACFGGSKDDQKLSPEDLGYPKEAEEIIQANRSAMANISAAAKTHKIGKLDVAKDYYSDLEDDEKSTTKSSMKTIVVFATASAKPSTPKPRNSQPFQAPPPAFVPFFQPFQPFPPNRNPFMPMMIPAHRMQ